jgi:hypothetical protein
MNLNRRQPSISHQQPQPSQDATSGNRHSFALGDTEQVNRLFGRMGTDWLGGEDPHPLQKTQSSLRPKSVMELGGSEFSNSWLLNNQRQPSLFHDTNVIERPRSADISSWTLPNQTWKPLGTDLWKNDLQHPLPSTTTTATTTTAASAAASAPFSGSTKNYGQFLTTPQNVVRRSSSFENCSNDLLGYGSDPSHSDASQRYANSRPTHMKPPSTAAIAESTKEEPVDMELLKGISHFFFFFWFIKKSKPPLIDLNTP